MTPTLPHSEHTGMNTRARTASLRLGSSQNQKVIEECHGLKSLDLGYFITSDLQPEHVVSSFFKPPSQG